MINALDSEDYQPEQMPALIRMFILPWAVFVCGSRGGGGGGCALLHLSNKSAVTCMEELVSAIVFKGSVCAVFRILCFSISCNLQKRMIFLLGRLSCSS